MGRWHAYYARRRGAEVTAVVDASPQAARALARRARGAGVFGDIASMLAAVRPDVVHLCTPPASHLELALHAVAAGAHVLVEKPLTPTSDTDEALLDAAARKGVHVCPVHQFAFQRGTARAKAALRELGDALEMRFTICSAGGEAHSDQVRDGIVADVLPHPFSVLQALWPERVLHTSNWHASRTRAGELHVRGECGSTPVSIWISLEARPTRCCLEIFCCQGTVHVDFFHGYARVSRGSTTRMDKAARPFLESGGTLAAAAANLAARAWRREPAYPGLSELIGAFHQAARGAGEVPIAAAEALALARVREGLMREAMPHLLNDEAAHSPGHRDPATPRA